MPQKKLFNCLSGTDATHAEHIETIKSRMYVGVRQDGRLVPGQLGMGLVEGELVLEKSCFIDINLFEFHLKFDRHVIHWLQ